MKSISICENGLCARFAVNDAGNLLLYGIFDDNDSFSEPQPPTQARYDALEIRTSGSSSRFNHGMKNMGFRCPEVPIYDSFEKADERLGKHYIFHLHTSELAIRLHYIFCHGTRVVRSFTEVENISDHNVGLEYLSSFVLTGIADNAVENVSENYRIMIPHNSWCHEFNWTDHSLLDLGYHFTLLETTMKIAATNTGTWSTKEHLPSGCLYSKKNNVAYLWQIESNTSWHWEIGDSLSLLSLHLSGPSEANNGWWKNLAPHEKFESVTAAIAFGNNFDRVLAEMTAYRRLIAYRSPADLSHPVIFNDYMKCLNAKPDTKKLIPVIDAASNAGAEFFCIDAGWYIPPKEVQNGWWVIGSWRENPDLFPGGFVKIFDYIRQKGMRPGLWVEPESIGTLFDLAHEWEDDCFFVRHGKRVVERGRLMLDMRNPKVRKHLDEVIDRLIAEYGIEYFKFDYNIDAGVGTETNADSFGDGLLECGRALLSWIDSLIARHPNLIIENCSSGGMRMDYLTLSHYSVQSLTDDFENRYMIQLAAAAPTGVLPEQGCVWTIPMPEMSNEEIASTMVNAMFRRVHLSGGTPNLSEHQTTILKEGVRIYKETRHLVDKLVPFYPLGVPDYNPVHDLIVAGFRDNGHCFLTVTNMGEKKSVTIPLDFMPKSADVLYPSFSHCNPSVEKNAIKLTLKQNEAVVLRIEL